MDEIERVTVHEPELRGNSLMKHHVYKITTQPTIVDHVFRRFKDFDWLRSSLSKLFPGVFVPPLPPKKLLGSTDAATVAERKVDLERFLTRVLAIPFMAKSAPFVTFMTQATLFEEACKESDKMVEAQDNAALLQTFLRLFPELMRGPSPDKSETRMAALREFCNNSEQKTQTVVNTVAALADRANDLTNELGKAATAVERLFTEEKGYPQCPEPARCDVLDCFQQWHLTGKQAMPSYYSMLLSNFKYELQDIEAFKECLSRREEVKVTPK
jgi:hypothetical protein